MRFSAAFYLPLLTPAPAHEPALPRADVVPTPPEPPQPSGQAPADPPEDLDDRVRMVGEWQIGEG
ncbi:MAG TPA: hypothetical protein VLK85_08150 [Ramlibacter sp.]|nr:hypothetical protein [Ramlibacter sp.]